MTEIDPKRLYGFTEAARLIPGSRKLGICLATLHAWRKEGRIVAVRRLGPGGSVRYFIWGSELAKLIPAPPPDASQVRSAAERKAGMRRAEKEAKRLGLITE